MPSPIVHTREVVCAAPRAHVWELITDTDRFNELAGFAPVQARRNEGKLRISSSFYGLESRYEEVPFEWEEGRRFSILRKMLGGPLQSLEMVFTLDDDPAGTRVTLQLKLIPASGILAPVAKVAGKKALSRMVKALSHVDAGDWEREEPRAASGVDASALERSANALRDLRPTPLADRLVAHVASAHDQALDPIRPYALADRWGGERRELLELCLHATLAGLLELRWDLICPSCRTSSESASALEEIAGSGHCELCDLNFELDLDRSVEAVFLPAPAVRRITPQTYCVGGPARTPHVVAQRNLHAGAAALPAPHEPGRYRLFVRGGATTVVAVERDAPGELLFEHSAGETTLLPALGRVSPGGEVHVHSNAEEAHAKLERLEWTNQAATANTVATLPTFRRRFAQHILRPGLSLKVGRVALLFSDLTGSTAMYSRLGDAIAFSLVQDHFDLLTQIIANHEGAIVKTIGDAVMAAFVDESRAVQAAISMLEGFVPFADEHEHGRGLTLKLGVYAGPCYAVTANDQLDYFGQTVNIAARLQGQAEAAQLVVTQALAERARAEGWLRDATAVEAYSAELKGVDEPIDVVRLALPQATPNP